MESVKNKKQLSFETLGNNIFSRGGIKFTGDIDDIRPVISQNIQFDGKNLRLSLRIGKGSFSIVCLAYDPKLSNQKYALKLFIDPNYGVIEWNILNELSSCRFVIKPISCDWVGTNQEFFGILMPVYKTLHTLQGKNFNEIIKIIQCLLYAISDIHEYGIIHRDIKIGNILTDSDGFVFLADFNLAIRTDSPCNQSGTLEYQSPWRVNHQTNDIWALGITLLRLLTNEIPFIGFGSNVIFGNKKIYRENVIEAIEKEPDITFFVKKALYVYNEEFKKDSREFNFFVSFISSALEKDFSKRPTAKSLLDMIQSI